MLQHRAAADRRPQATLQQHAVEDRRLEATPQQPTVPTPVHRAVEDPMATDANSQ
jgi:hypothetical protein